METLLMWVRSHLQIISKIVATDSLAVMSGRFLGISFHPMPGEMAADLGGNPDHFLEPSCHDLSANSRTRSNLHRDIDSSQKVVAG